MVWRDKMAKKKERAKEEGNGEEADEAQEKEQSPSIVDWPGAEDPLLLEQRRENGRGAEGGPA